jgi:hypothetical protein
MPERSKTTHKGNETGKRGQGPKDANQIAFMVVQQATGEIPKEGPKGPQKNQAAVTLGRLGGLKGGRARADKLTAQQRLEIAKKAAKTRWSATMRTEPK